MSLSPQEKLHANLESLRARLIKAQEKAEQAKIDGSPTANALQLGVIKMQEKIADVQAELIELEKLQPKPSSEAEQTAVEQALQKAKARATILANMSDEDKRAEQMHVMQTRLQKAKERLIKAEAEKDPNIAAFKKAVQNIEDKMTDL